MARNEFKHENGITFLNRTPHYDEIINIAAPPDNTFLENFYLSHQDFLNQFFN